MKAAVTFVPIAPQQRTRIYTVGVAMSGFRNSTITIFRRGIVKAINSDGTGTIRELTAWNAELTRDLSFETCGARFVEADIHRRYLVFDGQTRIVGDGTILESLRAPKVGDIVMYADAWSQDNGLHVTAWTYQVTYKQAEDTLPRCIDKGCTNAPRLGKRCCTFHAPREDYDPEGYDDNGLVSSTEVYSRALRRFGNTELAREAASLYPGDFI